MENLIANLSNKVQKRQLQGRQYLVAPVAMMVEGVLPGSRGPLLYSEAQIMNSVEAWNHKPITVRHPVLPNGEYGTGCAPEALDNVGVGMILNTKYNKRTKKLVAEAWFEVARLDIVPQGDIIRNALESGIKMEVSTGLTADVAITNGTFNGKEYVGEATNFRPDHLAILIDVAGACSIADGAGLLVNQKRTREADRLLVNAKKDQSLMELISEVREAVMETYCPMPSGPMGSMNDVWVEDVFKDSVIFYKNGEFFKQNFAQKDGSVTLLGDLIQVERKTTYEPLVVNTAAKMDRDTLIAKLGDSHKEFVANLSDEQVSALLALSVPVANSTETETNPEPAPEPSPAPAEVVTEVVANSVEDVVAAAPKHIQAQLRDALVANDRLRSGYITAIIENKSNKFSKDDLASFSTSQLERIAELATAPVVVANASTQPQPRFVGSAGSLPPAEVEAPLTLPSTAK